ncbi:N-terminal C2 in EEIG1 and EHBP1 proteins-domain-containing protein [Suillus bovinus]|uniref:N-terminal C2 in EEIG1 and EHBP1 proteins-domain-containing protein n=1 Tax=Suillus bovinus TaxID=48563 RepID=UPI001B880D99|nr:N-terminal C2 in EEIG1 and EHBP1 proteins-domain-containing protein [Suillus bovinus]KAG2159266.1 N-terminal C2 in EEIG1 and EHBP1 proteins-domain-containing protein [Suillus bovinus]
MPRHPPVSERASTAKKPCLSSAHHKRPPPDPRPKSPIRPASPTHTSFRAQLAHLLPRHAIFLLRLTIHQLSSVPFVNGEFEVRWKFKGVTSGGGLLGKVKSNRKGRVTASPTSAKGKEKEKLNECEVDPPNPDADAQSITNSNSSHSHSHDLSIPSVVVSSNTHVSPASTSDTRTTLSSSSRSQHVPPQYLSADWLPQSTPPDPSPSLAKSLPNAYAPAKGHTMFEQLKEHSVVWEHTLDVMVQMGITRETNQLGCCEAKFVVMQRVIPGDPDAPRNPRLGTVSLDLAQYVDAGVVTRRYLLRQSKTNATLKLTVQLEHISGESSYIAPPLPKGEILSGVAGLLDSDIFRTRPRTLDLYAHENSSSSSVSTISTHSSGKHRPKRKKNPLDASQLPNTRGIRGTEKLIEALFNPVPVTSPGQLTPFTYLHEVSLVHSRDPTTEDEHVRVDVEGEDEARLADESLYSNSNSVDLSHPLPARLDSESDYQSVYSKWTGSLRAPSVKSMAASRSGVNDGVGVSTAVSNTAIVEKRVWWRKVLHAGVAS